MESRRPYIRGHYRLPLAVAYPVMFSDSTTIAEGKITNLTVFGCTIECTTEPPINGPLFLRLLLPDQRESLPISLADIRWVNGKMMGLEFRDVERTANLRLHGFVWDRMLERLGAIRQQVASQLGSS